MSAPEFEYNCRLKILLTKILRKTACVVVVSNVMLKCIILNAKAQRKTSSTTTEEVRLFNLQQYLVIHLCNHQMLTIDARIQYDRYGN